MSAPKRRQREPRCRVCGCTQNRACASGCSWAEADLCTVCAVINDTIVALCSTSPRMWTAIKEYVGKHCARFVEEEDLDAPRIRRCLNDLLRTGGVVRCPRGRYQLRRVRAARRAS